MDYAFPGPGNNGQLVLSGMVCPETMSTVPDDLLGTGYPTILVLPYLKVNVLLMFLQPMSSPGIILPRVSAPSPGTKAVQLQIPLEKKFKIAGIHETCHWVPVEAIQETYLQPD